MKTVYIICCCKLISKNPRIDTVNALGQTPLLLLVGRYATDAVEELLRAGANIHKTDYNKEGFMFYALGAADQFERLTGLYLARAGDLNIVNVAGVI